MSDIYSTLSLSPKKKRVAANFVAETVTPKKLRLAPPTPPATRSRKETSESETLPPQLTRLQSIQTSLQQALSHALASCAASPSSDTGILPNVVNHISLSQYAGLSTNFTVQDLRRLCWLWEWDGKTIKDTDMAEDDDNPFLEASTPPSKDWTRGSMGFVISSATQFSKVDGKRVPAYGIGIEVEIDLDKDMGAGMAAVARWTAATESRRALFGEKLYAWAKMHAKLPAVPMIPLAHLPALSSPTKPSSLTRVFASMSPKSSTSTKDPLPAAPPSPSRSISKSPVKRDLAAPRSVHSISSSKSTILFPSTPSSSRAERTPRIINLRTPTSSKVSTEDLPSQPMTPRGRDPASVLQTPTTSRRQALYDRIRERSLSASPSKSQRNADVPGSKLTKDQLLKLGQEETRRRCLLGRLGGVAESVWMLFNSPNGSTSSPSRKRRTLPLAEVASAIVKSSPIPISTAEANESLELLITLCPFFLKQQTIGGEEWLEMPAPPGNPSSPSKRSPSKADSAQELATRSPKQVKREAGGLRMIREIIRRELELQD
ncbi:hypothetical protein GYMLUDRAFT_38864 [Collybiopsis luxurians FD-317 M1]|nr:hypothetical protein GYMLUDRAFT_38864 [Collybiopsis luxurians FD-317 M1]